MKTKVTLLDDGDQVLLIPETDADARAVSMMSALPGTDLVRRVVPDRATKQTRVCLLVRLGAEAAPLFGEDLDD